MIFDDIQKVYELAVAYIGNGRYFAFAIASLLFLFVTSKRIRPRLVYPILVTLAVIATPWLYHYVFNRDAYWRVFWMFPGAVLIALFCVRLIQTCENVSERIAMTVFLMLILFFLGTSMYSAERTRPDGSKERILTEVTNPEKVSNGAKRVADILLAIEDSPKVASRKKYVYELRQYSSKILLYYGRDIDGFVIPIKKDDEWRHEVHKGLESTSPDYNTILRICDVSGYNFLITSSTYRINEALLDKHGYREVAVLDGSAIYYKPYTQGQENADKKAAEQNGTAAPAPSEDTSAVASEEAAPAAEADTSVAAAEEQPAEEQPTEEQNTQIAVPDSEEAAPAEEAETQSAVNETGSEDAEVASENSENNGQELLEQFAANS